MGNSFEKSVSIITLGCSKNTVDSEYIARQLEVNGYEVYNDPENITSTIVIVNTCGFINDAKEESVNTILELIQFKKKGFIEILIVMGCLSQRYREELKEEMPEVDYFFGVFELPAIIEAIKGKYNKELKNSRKISTPSHYAFLKISEGCDRTCSFCAIPLIKGKHISKSIEDLSEETLHLTKSGVKEIMLIAQDLTYYGIDATRRQQLPNLIKKLTEIEELQWLRMHYIYPLSFPLDILRLMKSNEKICKYLDIPFQHINDKILKDMRRAINKQQSMKLIETIRKEVPDAALRTTLMVGFPGEGEKEYNELVDFVREVKFDRLGVFTYSEEEGTSAARNTRDNIPEKVKQQRMEEIMAIQQEISLEHNKNKIGKAYKTIIDRLEGEYYVGRTELDSPEVDNEVLIQSETDLTIGDFYNIEITDAGEYDILGQLV
ncbi:MAG: 30S ribosomal protein S12 methylthiotransferase RimO [Bacteroidales bacterium]|nr:30S ribosomal protein S12 methylthiotransferase RimO [Bacteroidales bacterium]